MKTTTFATSHRSQSDAQSSTGIWPRRFLALFVLLFTGLLAACQPIRPVTDQASAAASTNAAIEIVQQYYAALNAAIAEPAKVEEAMSFLAPNAIFINPTGSYLTLEEIRNSLVVGAADGLFFDLSNFRESGGRVVYDYKVKIGEDLLDEGTNGLTIVKNGAIIFDGTELTEPGFAAYADPTLVVQAYYAALNGAVEDADKVDLAMKYLADNARFVNPTGSYETLEEIRASLAGGATEGLTFDLSNFRNSAGRVVYDYKVKIGENLLDSGSDGLTIVKDGKIVFDGTERTEP